MRQKIGLGVLPSIVLRLLAFTCLLILCGGVPKSPTNIFSVRVANAATCATSLTVNLTVELAPELARQGDDVLIELREGVVGHSKVVSSQKFHGRTGTVFFAHLCAGSYFMDIGNGARVAVTPVHQFAGNGLYRSTIRVTFSKGNVATRNRNKL